jgi:Ca2+-binding RTX toxin-like protein
MQAGRSGRPGTAIAVATAALACTLAFAAPSLGKDSGVACSYDEVGAPGPPDNVLRVEDRSESVTHIYREGDAIVVFNNADRDPAVCVGGTPTVFNVDRIEYSASTGVPFFDYIGKGPLAPGATPETSGSEIEISVEEDYHPEVLNVGASAASDTVHVGQLGPHQVGLNLNSQADGAGQDADTVIHVVKPSEVFVRVVGKGGDDTLSALGGPEFTGPFPADRLSLSGGPGDDTMIGGPHRDLLRGDLGNDVMLGGRDDDLIKVGPGRDLARAGKGNDRIENESDVGGIAPDTSPDRVYAGAGNDQVDVAQISSPLPGDFVNCGAGRHDAVGLDPGDRTKNCEKVDVFRR